MPTDAIPVLLLAFDRPHYLRPVLESLAAQRLERCSTSFSFHFFQDGAVNRYSGIRYAGDGEIAAVRALIRSHFPRADLAASPDNVGVSEMFERAEDFAFRVLGAPYAIFLEDDMVLDPRYLATMAAIRAATEGCDAVGYFAAYGDHRLSPERLGALAGRPQRWRPMEHHWAFGLTRAHWEGMGPILAEYRALVHGRDYRRRPNLAVRRLFYERGVPIVATSQDAAKAAATAFLSRVRINVELPLARYIGQSGVHFTPSVYRSLGFGEQSPLAPDGDLVVVPPSDADIASLREEQSRGLDGFRSTLARHYGFRPVTRADVEVLYRVLLGREPESETVYEENVGRQLFVNLRRGIIDSEEFLGEN